MGRRTFVGVYDVILDYHVPPINSIILLGLAPHLAQVGRRLLDSITRASSGPRGVGQAQDMAGEEVIGRDSLVDAGAGGRFGLPGGEKYIGGGYQEDVLLVGRAL